MCSSYFWTSKTYYISLSSDEKIDYKMCGSYFWTSKAYCIPLNSNLKVGF
jgi:hypothetical protein